MGVVTSGTLSSVPILSANAADKDGTSGDKVSDSARMALVPNRTQNGIHRSEKHRFVGVLAPKVN